MKHRSITGLILAVALALAACAPPDTGGGSSAGPSEVVPRSSTHEGSHDPMESKAPSKTDGGDPYDYDY